MRALLLTLVLVGCAGPAPDPVDPTVRAAQLVDGFREAEPGLTELLDGAPAWALFEGVEDLAGPCEHAGRLFAPAGEPREVLLRCRAFTAGSPGGHAYHLLVVLGEEADLDRLETGPLDLSGARECSLSATGGGAVSLGAGSGGCWVVTTARGSLLFPAAPVAPRLELVLPGS